MKSIFLCITFLLLSISTWACSCMGPPTFCATMSSFSPADLVIRGTKISDFHYGMKVKVEEVLSGNTLEDTLIIWGDNGALCRWYTSGFTIGKEYILGINETDFAGNFITNPSFPSNLEDTGHYHISVCGIYWLTINGDSVLGAIDNGISSMAYNTFKNAFALCISTGIPSVNPLDAVEVYPNPVRADFIIRKDSRMNIRAMKLYNIQGKLERDFGQNLNSNGPFSVSGLLPGIYLLELESNGIRKVKKLILSD